MIRFIPRAAKINPQARKRLDWLAGESTADYDKGELFALLSLSLIHISEPTRPLYLS